MEAIINEYTREQVCVYKGRKYYVRDNGAINRQCKDDGVMRKWDEKWTFGKFDPNTGYMLIGKERVHRIVCTAYHGDPVGDRNVVDHIDTNRCNNRPENLRWVTRMENILDNPITMAKVELICGSREAFIANPSLLFGHESEDPIFMWMRNVTPEEAKASYDSWMEWANRPIEDRHSKGGSSGEWLYGKKGGDSNSHFYGFQRWTCLVVDRTEESRFPQAPLSTVAGEDVLQKYRKALVPGVDFLISRYYKTIVSEVVYFEEENKLRVLSKRIGGQRALWYIFEIWPEGSVLYHKIVGSYGKNKQKDIKEAMHDLTKYHRHEWKYSQNKPVPAYNHPTLETYLPEFSFLECQPREEKGYHPANNIVQRSWKTPTEFPMCPTGMPENPLEAYKQNMKIDEVFCRNRYGESFLKDVGYDRVRDALIVLTNQPGSLKEWFVSGIYIEDGKYVYETIKSCFEEIGGRKYFTIHTDGTWTGGEVLDDRC